MMPAPTQPASKPEPKTAPGRSAPKPALTDPRRPALVDLLLQQFDRALRTVAAANVAARPYPGSAVPEAAANPVARAEAAALMRVNHAGEIAAQALYHGQALTARNATLRAGLLAAAREETDHLAWCEQRVRELGGRTSVLAPLWYAGSFAIGALAGLTGDRRSLGFVEETERQVVEHLDEHLQRLPPQDARSRAVVMQMQDDEARHGADARNAGASVLPSPIRALMRTTARFMTRTAHRL